MTTAIYLSNSQAMKKISQPMKEMSKAKKISQATKRREKRDTWMLCRDCGHLVHIESKPEELLPVDRTLEVLLSTGDEQCIYCKDPSFEPLTLRTQLTEGRLKRAHHYHLYIDEKRSDKARILSAIDVVQYSLDNSYIEGILEGAMAPPVHSIVYQNHNHNAFMNWSAQQRAIISNRKMAVAEELLPKRMEDLEYLFRTEQTESDCVFAFAQGKLLGQLWADLQRKAIPSPHLGPQLPESRTWQVDPHRSCSVRKPLRGWGKGAGINSKRTIQNRRVLIKMALKGQRQRAEKEEVDRLAQFEPLKRTDQKSLPPYSPRVCITSPPELGEWM
ncbi:uncharacterized protein RCO7_04940 [Rhynchosporium graminicola]|uniref:Uncharacterized protein n=1 Tax=Rhynchosporium graminicola TaxID=2792576 RepID=A0A1E1KE53_9HELO|nr:uncharacterized protein RCO7_04940 [Rhynchosporium commune]